MIDSVQVLAFWRQNEKFERENRKKAEKAAIEQRKHEDELREARRQQRKFNFLITQTELYAHFMQNQQASGLGFEFIFWKFMVYRWLLG